MLFAYPPHFILRNENDVIYEKKEASAFWWFVVVRVLPGSFTSAYNPICDNACIMSALLWICDGPIVICRSKFLPCFWHFLHKHTGINQTFHSLFCDSPSSSIHKVIMCSSAEACSPADEGEKRRERGELWDTQKQERILLPLSSPSPYGQTSSIA